MQECLSLANELTYTIAQIKGSKVPLIVFPSVILTLLAGAATGVPLLIKRVDEELAWSRIEV
jgi:hypothetical protein